MAAKPIPRLRFLMENSSTRYATWDNILIAHGNQPLTQATARTYVAQLRDLVSRYPAGAGVITIIERTSPPPPEARDIFVRGYTELKDAHLHAVFLIRTVGFLAATIRAVIATFGMVSNRRGAIYVCSSTSDAVHWMAQRLTGGALKAETVGDLREAIDAFTASDGLDAPPPQAQR